MNSYFFLYNTSTGQILGARLAASSPYTPGTGEAVASFPANDATAALAVNNPQWYLIAGSPATLQMQPYWTVTTTESTTTAGEYTLTATLNSPPASPPTQATFTIAGGTINATISSNQATGTIQLHASVANQPVTVSVSASGTVSGQTTINSGTASVGLQLITSGTTPLVAPAGTGSRAYLRAFFLGLTPATQVEVLTKSLQSLALTSSIISHIGLTKIIPALTASTYTPITLTAAEQTALASWQQQVAQYQIALADLLDSAGNPTGPYAELQAQAPLVQEGINGYAQALATLPNLD